MGMLMWFYVGDKTHIGEGYSAMDTIPLWKNPCVVATADVSLHLSPIDLELLSEEACRIAGVEPVTLTDSIRENIGGDGESSSADVVSIQWVQTVASILDDQIEDLAKRWMVRVAEEHGEQTVEANRDTLRAVRDLIHACRVATEKGLAVVHVWSF
jgi:hypothetical protein